MTITIQNPIAERVVRLDWSDLCGRLDIDGFAVTHPLLSTAECANLAALFDDEERLRSTVDMARRRFGAAITGSACATASARSPAEAEPRSGSSSMTRREPSHAAPTPSVLEA